MFFPNILQNFVEILIYWNLPSVLRLLLLQAYEPIFDLIPAVFNLDTKWSTSYTIDSEGDYRFAAMRPDLPNLLVGVVTSEEVIDLAPEVASALITSMKASGDKFPPLVRLGPQLSFSSRGAVSA